MLEFGCVVGFDREDWFAIITYLYELPSHFHFLSEQKQEPHIDRYHPALIEEEDQGQVKTYAGTQTRHCTVIMAKTSLFPVPETLTTHPFGFGIIALILCVLLFKLAPWVDRFPVCQYHLQVSLELD